MKKIIHVSDLHIGYKDFAKKAFLVFDHIKDTVAGKVSQYVVVITGDLVHNANIAGSYAAARAALEHLKDLGFMHVLVIPGNHDYGPGNRGNKKFVKAFKDVFYDSEIEYPKVDIIDGVAFIGLDSMAAELHWYDDLWADGQLENAQIAKLRMILRDAAVTACAKRVIYLHHHPFGWRPLHQLKDSRAFKKVLVAAMKNGLSIDALLFGHNHQGNAHNGRWGIPRCYDAGTATLKSRPPLVKWATWYKVQASTRIIDLAKDPGHDVVVSNV